MRWPDGELDREVAIKVLPPELVSDPERKRRFVLEAKAAAALQHPHIATIYEIDEAEGTTFIAMELIQGQTLTEALRRDRLPLGRSLELASETAEGLARAHERGIVHRDLKPANLMLTQDGHIKIIDFGLAKLIEPVRSVDSDQDTALRGTEPGKMLGTVAYMSPEQARGRSLDHRSDVFSLGTVLFEMITGRLPFEGPSAVETLNAIVKEPAPPLTVTGPERDSRGFAEAQRIVQRCLAKDPGDRYQTMKDLLSELRHARRESDSGVSGAGVAVPGVRALRRWLIPGALAVAVLAAVVYFARPRDGGVPKLTNPMQLTSALGAEQYAIWSPDGGRIAYQGWGTAGNLDIWVTQSRGGPPVNWTSDHDRVDRTPNWSPDGSQIAFASQREGGGCFVMSALGGKARKVLSTAGASPAWSADGSRLACVVRDAEGSLFIEIVSLTSRESQRVPVETPTLGVRDVSWSPDGRHFAYVDANDDFNEITRLRLLRLSDGKTFGISDGMAQDWSPSWSADGRRLFFVSNRKGSMDLWQQGIGKDGAPEGEPQRITTGLGIRTAAFSRDGSKLVYSRGRGLAANVWRVPILEGRRATWSDAQQLTFDDALVEFLDLSPDGTRLVVSSDRSGNQDLWTLPTPGGEMQPLTDHPTPDWDPSWSPDGKEIAFYAYRSGNRDIWVMPLDGRTPRQLTRAAAQDWFPTWSADGKQIAFTSSQGGKQAVWVVPAEGGEPKRLSEPEPVNPVPAWSPDGKWIAFLSDRSGATRVWRIPADGGEAEQLTSGPTFGPPCWSREGKEIYFLAGGERGSNLWAFSLEGRSERPLTDFTGRPGNVGAEDLATDGQYLYFTWEETVGDLWVMDVAWE